MKKLFLAAVVALTASATSYSFNSDPNRQAENTATAEVTAHSTHTKARSTVDCETAAAEAAPTNITLSASNHTVCAGSTVTLEASAAGAAAYNFNNAGWQTANTTDVTVTANATYTVKAASASGYESAEATTTVAVYPAFTAGAITTAAGVTTEGTAPGPTVTNSMAASGGDGTITYQWQRSGASSDTLTGNAASYPINNDASNYVVAGTYYIKRYARDGACNTSWVEADGKYTLTVAFLDPCCNHVWSEPIRIAACDKTVWTAHSTAPMCRSDAYNGIKYYYYNWPYMDTNKKTMCPSPWRVPDADDFDALLNCLGTSPANGVYYPESSTWCGALAGFIYDSSLRYGGLRGLYWSSTESENDTAYSLDFTTSSASMNRNLKTFGMQIRCVRDL
ncbi:MAG: DUF1566 domain-containing protein [Prevotellaceae bacterium]|jgi:uncharacterized protein (TIGR02145 family)|nr:DUF1566 domain-containing protein [Prevotellaceae bacterium]